MTKDVIVTISGLQIPAEGDAEPMEVITNGTYYKKNGKHYVLYDEVVEGYEEGTKNVIKLYDNCLDVTKKGVSTVHMLFEKDKKNMSYYYTPFGSLLIGILAKDVTVEETEQNIDIAVDYALEVNYEHLAECTIKMNIKAKNSGGFSLI